MPQLDQFTYFTQFLWLCVFYLSFYVLLCNDGLPKISRILKLRKQFKTQKSSDLAKYDADPVFADVVIKECLNTSIVYLCSSVSGASKWCDGMINSLNANQLQSMNQNYVRSMGEMSVSQVIKRKALENNTPSLVFRSDRFARFHKLQQPKIYVLREQRRLLESGQRRKKNQNA
uniref:H(+)-transporting two-sector ATPase n=1 Tax=Nitellopsis obtusa TaxID=40811 RepID=A0A8F6YGL0_9VIRI|nr:ATP synthase F0 subunit 8 [Nitellopsis obtusa]